MVALNTADVAPKNEADTKNRVGDFFYEDHASVGKNRWVSRLNTQEKSCYHYETASGCSNWSNRDPIQEQGGLNLYGMVQNNPIDYCDYLGMSWGRDRIEDFVSPNPKLPENQNIKYYGESLSQESLNQGAQNLEDLGKGIMSSAYGAAKDGVNYLKNGALKAGAGALYDEVTDGAGALYDAVTDYFESNQNNRRGDGRRGRGGDEVQVDPLHQNLRLALVDPRHKTSETTRFF